LKHESQRHFKLYHQAVKDISKPLGRKRAKESARYFLGYNTQLNFDWQMNFRSFVNIQKLRNSHHAQFEIRSISNTMLYLVENIPNNPFEYSLKAFGLKSDPTDLLI
jgi:thymidylate synthase ThyX